MSERINLCSSERNQVMKVINEQLNKSFTVLSLALLCVMMSAGDGWAQETAVLVPVDGFLTDADAQVIDGAVEVTFSLYADSSGESPFWTETHALDVDGGAFSAYLGSFETLNADHFEQHRAPYLSLQVEDDDEMDRWPLGHVPFAAFAEQAGDAQTLQGMTPEELGSSDDGSPVSAGDVDFDDSASQLGASSSQAAIEELAARLVQLEQERDAMADDIAALSDAQSATEGRVDDVEGDISSQDGRLSSVEADVASLGDQDSRLTDVEMDIADQDTRMTVVEDDLVDQEARLTSVETEVADVEALASGFDARISEVEAVTAPMSRMSVNGQDSVVFDDVNVHVRSGEGSTNADVNGRGNLIVGYDEAGSGTEKTGSHNLVLGRQNSYTSFGGFVGGERNTISGNYASVVSGADNEASGTASMVGAGFDNEADGFRSVVTGGWTNEVSGSWSVVSGGDGVSEGRDNYWRGGGLSSQQ